MNTNKLINIFIFLIATTIFVAFIFVNNSYLKDYKLDLTEGKIYTLSKGSQTIIKNIEDPIQLQFFFSDSTSKGLINLRDYATRVESLLEEYSQLSKGKIKLDIINPKPFSEQEDKAAEFGLAGPTIAPAQDIIYFGLVGTNSRGDTFIISFFDPQKEPFLEYDISSMIYKLSHPEAPKLTVVSDLQLAGGQNMLTGNTTPANVIFEQLGDLFNIQLISSSIENLPETDVLLLWHPQNINAQLLLEIDQYIMNAGSTVALVDPHFESDPLTQMGAVGANSSELPLLEVYGITVNPNEVVLDALAGIEVQTRSGQINRHLGYLGLGSEQINQNDITTADLEAINGASFGSLGLAKDSRLKMTSLLMASNNASVIDSALYANINDVLQLSDYYHPMQKERVLAARYTGFIASFFADPQRIDNLMQNNSFSEPLDIVRTSKQVNLVIIADADIATDRFWVQKSDFFGQTVLSHFANNADFLINIIENMAGSEGLIGIRGKGTISRPFKKVQNLQLQAEQRFREQEQLLQVEVEQTEARLVELRTQADNLVANAEQQKAIDEFTAQRIEIRRSLREVKFQLENDINQLGNQLKLINIVYAPIILILILIIFSKLFCVKAPTNNLTK